jgi:hypothetical protein
LPLIIVVARGQSNYKLQRDSKTELCLAGDFTQNPPAGILSAMESTSTKSAADWGFHCNGRNGAIPSLLVQLQLELQRVEQSVIKPQIVDGFVRLRRKAKLSSLVGCCRTKECTPLLAAISYCHAFNWRARGIKNKTLDLLSGLRFLNFYKFSYCLAEMTRSTQINATVIT